MATRQSPHRTSVLRRPGRCFPDALHYDLRPTFDNSLCFVTSRRISRAALWPDAPLTPPPGCVPAPQR